ncbi:14878_t:CDS:2 [Gigaspora margarita]|uniref:14878_t:CDS:1 n=1 Tax=Gigaspora margarita TaxID=4874 RepID=A0ABN7UTN5_GIGMA|nr:14878_t:CDS:2 [Gigaspora margarita]
MTIGSNKITKKKPNKASKRKKDGIPGLIDDVYGRISYMRRQKRRNKEELHGYIDSVIKDYERFIECLKNLNKFDAAVREQELKQAFDTEKKKYDEKIKELEQENTSLKHKIVELENNFEQMELEYNNQVGQMTEKIDKMEIEIDLKDKRIVRLEDENWILNQNVACSRRKKRACD